MLLPKRGAASHHRRLACRLPVVFRAGPRVRSRAGDAVYGFAAGAAEQDCACAQGLDCPRRSDEIDDAPSLMVPNLTVFATGHPLCRPRSARRSKSSSSVAPFAKMKESARSSNTAVTRFSFKRRSWVLCMILSSRWRSGILSRFSRLSLLRRHQAPTGNIGHRVVEGARIGRQGDSSETLAGGKTEGEARNLLRPPVGLAQSTHGT